MENNYLEKKFILNPDYRLINDVDRIILISDRGSRYFFNFIHPMHAILLSFFKGNKPMKETVKEISSFFSIPEKNVVKTDLLQIFLRKFLYQKKVYVLRVKILKIAGKAKAFVGK